jgi:cytidylate kinase
MRYFFGANATDPAVYDFVVNSERVPLDDTVAGILHLINPDTSAPSAIPAAQRVATLSRELGAWGTDFIPALAKLLDLHVCDRELVEEEARRLGVSALEVMALDERPVGLIDFLSPTSLYQRYVAAMKPVVKERAAAGAVLLVGRAGNRLLADDPVAFHLRLVAPLDYRIRRVMAWHWMREGPAARLIATTDRRRAGFAQTAFGANWNDPLEYHLTLNTGRLGPPSVDLAGFFARLHWLRAGGAP